MPITFSGLVSVLANTYKAGKAIVDWSTDAVLRKDFQSYLSQLEMRRVLYAAWEYENIHGVQQSLSEIIHLTTKLRADHANNKDVGKILGHFIRLMQDELDTIRGCNMHSRQGEFMAYKSLLRIRSEMAKTLAIFCGMLDIHPRNTELEQLIMNMALVRPKA
jgi:hypothetical protein